MSKPAIICLCASYKRPQLLKNAVACFNAQTYANKYLLVLDTADQFESELKQTDSGIIHIKSQAERPKGLSATYNYMVNELIQKDQFDIFAVWDDDDVYFPDHLENMTQVYTGEAQYFTQPYIYSNYQQPKGTVFKESAEGRFHGCWGYTRKLWEDLNGYPDIDSLDFDFRMGQACIQKVSKTYYSIETPSYVYRWGNGIYHISQHGLGGYNKLWETLESFPAPFQGPLLPEFDEETKTLYTWKAAQ